MKGYLMHGLMGVILLCTITEVRAVNDAIWLGPIYSVGVKYLDDDPGEADPPRPKSLQMPDYPIELMQAKFSGDAIVYFDVAKDGARSKHDGQNGGRR